MSEHNAQIASLDGMPKKEKKKVLKRMVREVMKDKRYQKAIKKSPAPVSKKAANAAATAAVRSPCQQPQIPPDREKKAPQIIEKASAIEPTPEAPNATEKE